MAKLFQFEWKKLFCRKWLWILLSILLGCYVLLLPKPEIEETTIEYTAWLNYVEDQTESMSGNVLFGSEDSYSQRNLEKISQVYSRLDGIELIQDPSGGVRMATDYSWTEIFLAAAIVLFVCYLFLQEQEEGLSVLLHPTKYGGGKLFIAKQLTLMCASILLTSIFFIGAMVHSLFYSEYGFLGRSIQSVAGYLASPYRITLLQGLIGMLLWKIFAIFAFSSVVMLLGAVFRRMMPVIGMTAGIALLEVLGYRLIGAESFFWPIREMNLAALWDASGVFSSYNNLNLGGFPIDRVWVLLFFGSVVIIVCQSAGIYLLIKTPGFVFSNTGTNVPAFKRLLTSCRGIRLCKTSKIRTANTALWKHECYKLLIGSKGMLVFVIFVALEAVLFSFQSTALTPTERSYRNISENLVGELTQEKENYFREQKKRLSDNSKELESYIEQYENGEISEELLLAAQNRLSVSETYQEALTLAENQYYELEYLSSENEKERILYIDQCVWNHWLGSEGKLWKIAGMALLMCMLSFVLSDYFTAEYVSGMYTMQKIYQKGFRAVNQCKLRLSMCYAIVLTGILLLTAFCRSRGIGKFGEILLSTRCVTVLAQAPIHVPLLLWWIGYCGLYLAIGVGLALLISSITRVTKKRLPTIFLSLILCGIAIFLVIRKINF